MGFIQKFVFFVFLVFGSVSQAEVYDVSTTPELREALASAGDAGGDNTIRLAAGTYSTQDDGEGMFRYISATTGTISLVAQNKSQKPVLDGAGIDQIFQYFGPDDGLSLTIDSLAFENAGNHAIAALDTRLINLDIANSEFSNNATTSLGGAIRFWTVTGSITDSVFEGNKVPELQNTGGGAISIAGIGSSFEITTSIFIGNTALRGGAIYSSGGGGRLSIKNSRFEGNEAYKGGAISAGSYDVILNNYFDGNQAEIGAAVFRGTVISNTFLNNGVSAYRIINNLFISSGVSSETPMLVNNNLFFDTGITVQDGDVLTNNIFLGADSNVDRYGDNPYFLTLSNNYIDPSAVDSDALLEGDGNIYDGVNLGFVNTEEGDYRLASSSDLIDAGTTDPDLAYITDYDYTGTTARVIGASIDIGPYEYDGEAPPDSDGDGLNDNIDNCPSIANEDQADNDSDGDGDACDSDDDNDGTNDEDDAFPFDVSESLDTDGDGIGNNEDEDDDGDGTLDDSDPQPVIANVFAIDSDGDGVADSIDDYPTDATKQFGSDGDFDGDGFTNDEEVDYCSNPFDKNSQPDTGGLSTPMIHLLTEQ